ncbi:MAG TPA: nitrous oxide reductase family maturation protein NosD [Usitatibacter sp.]|nr:nitrous oxide reductase family maturation protein NosD [Usitatibacter sp.]
MAALKVFPALLLAAASLGAHAAEWSVHPGESIAQAIGRAAPGDTVSVERGHYDEHLVIDKPLTLRGVDRPTISAGNTGDVIRVKSSDVTIEGLILRDSGDDLGAENAGIFVEPGSARVAIRRNVFAYTLFGIWLQKADDAEVRGNLITGKRDHDSAQRGNGIQLYDSQRARIEANEISFTRDGIYVDISHHARFVGNRIHNVRYGTHYMNSWHNIWENNDSYHNRGGLALMEVRDQVVRGNRAWGNSDHGIMLRTIQDSVIEDNVVAGNARGFFIYDAEHNTIRGNLVAGNSVGAHVAAGSYRNAVDDNDFVDNAQQVRYVASRDEPWGKNGGNFWSNYAGWDNDGDGAGDVPYEASDLVDRLTWRYPLARLLMNSPAVHALRLVSQAFPILRAPSVVDAHPRMTPRHTDWRKWIESQRH